MRIGSNGVDGLGSGGVGSVGGVANESRTSANGAYAKSDSVSLSNAASLVALAKASSTSRQAKIQTLSADVKSGRYQTDTSQVSHAVVESHIQG